METTCKKQTLHCYSLCRLERGVAEARSADTSSLTEHATIPVLITHVALFSTSLSLHSVSVAHVSFKAQRCYHRKLHSLLHSCIPQATSLSYWLL